SGGRVAERGKDKPERADGPGRDKPVQQGDRAEIDLPRPELALYQKPGPAVKEDAVDLLARAGRFPERAPEPVTPRHAAQPEGLQDPALEALPGLIRGQELVPERPLGGRLVRIRAQPLPDSQELFQVGRPPPRQGALARRRHPACSSGCPRPVLPWN